MVLAELHSCSFFADLEGPFSVKFRVPGGVRVAAPAARGRPMRRLREGALMAASSPCIVPNLFLSIAEFGTIYGLADLEKPLGNTAPGLRVCAPPEAGSWRVYSGGRVLEPSGHDFRGRNFALGEAPALHKLWPLELFGTSCGQRLFRVAPGTSWVI